jgi:hypothetical protein
MGAGDYLLTDPGKDEHDLSIATQFFAQVRAAQLRLTEEQAVTASNLSRFYLTPSGELTAAIAESGLEWDMPMIKEIVEREQDQAWAPFRALHSATKRATRTGVAVLDSIWDGGFSKPMRVATEMLQGESFGDAYAQAGQSYAGQAARATAQGRDYTLGEGWVPNKQEPWQDPAFKTEYFGRVQKAIAAGRGDLEHIYDQTLADMQDDLPVDIVTKAWDAAENTQIYKTLPDGTVVQDSVSLGKVMGMQLANVGGLEIMRPHTLPYKFFTGTIDAVSRVGLDPLNIPADALTDAMRSYNLLVPDMHNGTAAGKAAAQKALDMSSDWRYWVSPKTIDKWAETRTGKRVLNFLAKSGSESEAHG